MKKLSILILVTVVAGAAIAQDKELWPKWDKGKVNKMLNSSPWAQTQTDTDTSEMTYSPTSATGTSSVGQPGTASQGAGRGVQDNRTDRGASNQAMSVNYHVRFLSARPIRQAFARMIEIQEKDSKSVREQLGPFVARDFSEFIVVTVTFEASDNRFAGPVLQAFASATHGTLKNQSYLERGDGKRLFVMDYKPPTNDGLGAKFIFPRQVDGQSFLADSGDVRFFAQVSDKITLTTKYKLQDMMYDGKLEY
ncbi:MAG TPA: hypothetical protein VFI24_10870 [Pyrinomonadaceae bacterium]|nr:hypothetical protein [Pyrinomonadaceae bacterium]